MTDEMKNELQSNLNSNEIRTWDENRMDMRQLLERTDAADYMMVWLIQQKVQSTEQNPKFYLKDIATAFDLPVHTVSNIVRKLQDDNLVVWKHDGTGEDGTYVQITAQGNQLVSEKQARLEDSLSQAMEAFGEDRFRALLRELAAFEEVVHGELDKEEPVYDT